MKRVLGLDLDRYMDFLVRLFVNSLSGLFKYHVDDDTYNKVKKVFTFVSIIGSILILGYFLVLYLLFSGYNEAWFIYSLNYIHSLFNF